MTTEVAPSARSAPSAKDTLEAKPEAEDASLPGPWKRRWSWIRRVATVVLVGAAAWFLAQRGTELRHAVDTLRRVDWRLIGLAVLFEAASMVVFARMQRLLVRAGGVDLSLRTMVEITLAGNAIAATLPGGVAWAASWAFGQLRRRGVSRFLRVWVFLVAGALSSFALFVVVAVGIEVAGNRGPVADLRWAAVSLAALPIAGLLAALARRSGPMKRFEAHLLAVVRRLPGSRFVLGPVRSLLHRLDEIHLSPLHWLEVLVLAMLNWLYDAAVLACALLALHVAVPWRGLFVIYGITQIAASFPITPGGLVVVEGSLAALLTAYGVHPQAALATVVLYRIVSFWGVVPIGWAVWVGFDLVQRRGRTSRPHPWAFHGHRDGGDETGALPKPTPCSGCEEEAKVPPADGRKASSWAA
jgi:putative heme transporter